jgi:hypothetical protein
MCVCVCTCVSGCIATALARLFSFALWSATLDTLHYTIPHSAEGNRYAPTHTVELGHCTTTRHPSYSFTRVCFLMFFRCTAFTVGGGGGEGAGLTFYQLQTIMCVVCLWSFLIYRIRLLRIQKIVLFFLLNIYENKNQLRLATANEPVSDWHTNRQTYCL